MQNEFKNPAEPLAIEDTNEFIKISLLPVTVAATPENSFLNMRATVTEEPTAAKYPYAKSCFV